MARTWAPTPFDVSGCTCLLLPDRGVTLSTGANVASWTGLESANRAWSRAGVNYLTYTSSDSTTGRPYLTAASVDYRTTATLGTLVTSTAYTVWVVFYPTVITSTSAIAYTGDELWSDLDGYAGMTLSTVGGEKRVYAYNYNSGEKSTYQPLSSLNAWHCARCRQSSGNLYLSVDGAFESSVATVGPAVTTSIVKCGLSVGVPTYYAGRYACFCFYNRALSTAEIDTVERWLRAYFNSAWR